MDQEKEKPDLKGALQSLKTDKKGRVKGTIPCTLYSSEYIQYEEIKAEKNAYVLAMKLGIKTDQGSKQFQEEKMTFQIGILMVVAFQIIFNRNMKFQYYSR